MSGSTKTFAEGTRATSGRTGTGNAGIIRQPPERRNAFYRPINFDQVIIYGSHHEESMYDGCPIQKMSVLNSGKYRQESSRTSYLKPSTSANEDMIM